MWIRLKCTKQIDRQGVMRTYRPGDWVDVGKQTALLWISQGAAEAPNYTPGEPLEGSAGLIVFNQDNVERFAPLMQQGKLPLKIVKAPYPQICFDLNLIWDGVAPLRPGLIASGFSFLKVWEIACPLFSYTDLALSAGTGTEQELTRHVVHDLRVPLYDTRIMFVRNTEVTQDLFRVWAVERGDPGDNRDERLAFLRAFYQVKPLMLALPLTWTQPGVYADA